jgi:hypothetical protein
LASRLGETEVRTLTAISCTVLSLRALSAQRVSALVGYSPTRVARIRTLKLPVDMERVVTMQTFTQAYLHVAGAAVVRRPGPPH